MRHKLLLVPTTLALLISGCTAAPPVDLESEPSVAIDATWVANTSAREQTFEEAFATWTKEAEFQVAFPRGPLDARPPCKDVTLSRAAQAVRITSQLHGDLGGGAVTSNTLRASVGGPADGEPLTILFGAARRVFLEQEIAAGGAVGFSGATIEYTFPKHQDARLLATPVAEITCATKGWAGLTATVVVELGEPVKASSDS